MQNYHLSSFSESNEALHGRKINILNFWSPHDFQAKSAVFSCITAYMAAASGQRAIFSPKLKFEYWTYTCFLTFGNAKLSSFHLQIKYLMIIKHENWFLWYFVAYRIFFNFMKNRIFLLNFETDLALYVALEVSISMLHDLYALQICTMTY